MTCNIDRVSEDCYLYGVFDGHCGTRAAEFVSQRLPAEIVLDQLNNVTSDDEIQNVLQQVRFSWLNLFKLVYHRMFGK